MGSKYSGSNLQGKGDIRNWCCYRAVKLLEHGMKVVEHVFEKMLHRIVSGMQFGLMPWRGTIDAVFILRRLQEEYYAKGKKLYVCFVDLENDRVRMNVLEWAMRKKEIPEVFVRSVLSLYEGARARFRVDCELSEEFEVNVGMHHRFMLSPFLFAVVVDVTELARECVLSELLYTDDIVLMSETIL